MNASDAQQAEYRHNASLYAHGHADGYKAAMTAMCNQWRERIARLESPASQADSEQILADVETVALLTLRNMQRVAFNR